MLLRHTVWFILVYTALHPSRVNSTTLDSTAPFTIVCDFCFQTKVKELTVTTEWSRFKALALQSLMIVGERELLSNVSYIIQ